MNFSIDARGINLYKGSGIGTYIENLTLELLNIDKKITIQSFGLEIILKNIKGKIQRSY